VAARRTLLLLLAFAAANAGSEALHEHPDQTVLAPGYADLEFVPPAPGTYDLPSLGIAADGAVLFSDGQARHLYDLIGDKITVLSFIYTSCSDVNGCPLAAYVLRGVAAQLEKEPTLQGNVRLLSVSFDPAHDTPVVMAEYAARLVSNEVDWRFVTSAGPAQIDPILTAYDQWVQKDFGPDGRYLGSMSHILRVYLIDRQRRIRNIYSMSYLHADIVMNDIRTLLLENPAH
jgi:cytochrome c peroxidase